MLGLRSRVLRIHMLCRGMFGRWQYLEFECLCWRINSLLNYMGSYNSVFFT
jgi:hypothetical protein